MKIRHIICASEDMKYKRVNHQVLIQEGTTQKYILSINKSLFLLKYPAKTVSSPWQAAESINYEISKKIISF